MTDMDSKNGTVKWWPPTEPLVHHHGQCILIASWHRVSLDLLGGHISGRPFHFSLTTPLFQDRGNHGGNAKICQPGPVAWPKQHILGLDIAVNHALIMDIL